MIHLFKHNIDQSAISDCLTTLQSGWHTSGPVGKKVEKAISEYYSSTGHDYYAALTSSCTSGLIATAMALDLQEGDEIITTPMTFVATSASFMLRGAKPVFVDIDDQGLIDVDKVEAAVTPATKGIWVVNLYGHMPDMRRLRQIADKHDLFLMEDCAHAFDSSRDGYRPATWSHAACYSFYATKNTHCGEGGAVVSRDKSFIEKIINIRRHGMSKFPQPGELGNMGYDVVRLGFKGNLSDISASLLLSQIPKAEEYRSQRQEIANRYLKSLSNLKHVRPIVPDEGVQSSWYTFPLLAENRESLRQAFWEHEIGHTIMYSSLESFTLFGGGKDITCPKALEFSRKQVSIPCYPSLTVEEQNKVIRVIRDWDNQCI